MGAAPLAGCSPGEALTGSVRASQTLKLYKLAGISQYYKKQDNGVETSGSMFPHTHDSLRTGNTSQHPRPAYHRTSRRRARRWCSSRRRGRPWRRSAEAAGTASELAHGARGRLDLATGVRVVGMGEGARVHGQGAPPPAASPHAATAAGQPQPQQQQQPQLPHRATRLHTARSLP